MYRIHSICSPCTFTVLSPFEAIEPWRETHDQAYSGFQGPWSSVLRFSGPMIKSILVFRAYDRAYWGFQGPWSSVFWFSGPMIKRILVFRARDRAYSGFQGPWSSALWSFASRSRSPWSGWTLFGTRYCKAGLLAGEPGANPTTFKFSARTPAL
jgi:hypothetical protein